MDTVQPSQASRSLRQATLRDSERIRNILPLTPTNTMARMTDGSRSKIQELLARHTELQQSETKAQAAMVTILSLTQITELKLLLDIGRTGHRFYDFVLTMLIACISLELLIGIIIIYIGNLHYYQQQERGGNPSACSLFGLFRLIACLCCRCRCCGDPCRCCRRRGAYSSVMETSTSSAQLKRPTSVMSGRSGGQVRAPTAIPEAVTIDSFDDEIGCCGFYPSDGSKRAAASTLADLEQADIEIESARIKAADAELRIVRSNNYIKAMEEAVRRASVSTGQSGLEDELAALRAEHTAALGDKQEAEAERRLAEARQYNAFYAREQAAERRERVTFRKLSRWQHGATYLLYFVMLMNVFVTTFGISGSTQDLFVSRAVATPGPAGYHNNTAQ